MKTKSSAKSVLAYLELDEGVEYAVYPALGGRRRQAGTGHPEEKVRMDAYNLLITKYGYPAEYIDIEYPVVIREDETPRYADIVVCSDTTKKRPLIVVEAKKPNQSDGEKQGQRYATILRAVWVWWTNGADNSTFEIVNRYPEDASPISDIPPYGGAPKYKVTSLVPFKDDKQITTAFRRCHNLIRNLSHLKPDQAFHEFLKVLLVKLQDESKTSDFEFQILTHGASKEPESPNVTAQRLRQIYKLAAEEDSEIADVFRQEDDIALTNDCLAQIVGELQKHSFQQTPVDQKGRAFETFISGDMRQEFKEFMTPRPVVSAIVEMANPDRQALILDPCCGSGAFLINSLLHVAGEIGGGKFTPRQISKYIFDFAHDKLWGFDASKQMASVARIAMIMNDDGRAHVFHHDSLLPREAGPEQAKPKKFKLILTNPPFGKRIAAKSSILEHFELAKDDKGRLKKSGSVLTEVLFLERNLSWLDKDGRMFIVLPDSVLGNKQLLAARSYIETVGQLVAVISLSPDTFGPSGAKSKTSVVVLRKIDPARESDEDFATKPVFVAHVPNVGYDFTGRKTGKDDLPNVVAEYRKFVATGKSDTPLTKAIPRSQLGDTWLAQPVLGYGMPSVGTSSGLRLGDLCEAGGITTGKTASRAQYQKAGLHLVKVGNLTGHGIEWCSVERQFVDDAFWTKHIGARLEKGDILLTAAAHGPKWIGLKVDIFEGAPPHLDQRVMCCGELMRIRLKPDCGIDPYYLLLFLRSPAGYQAIQSCIRGQSGHLYPAEVSEIMVPDPADMPQDVLNNAVKSIKRSHAQRRLAVIRDNIASKACDAMFPSDAVKPVIAL